MKQLLIYTAPVQLNRQVHQNTRLRAATDMRFAAGINSAPLVCTEFAHAARHFPIVFAGPSVEAVVPAALLGLKSGQNLMLDSEGQWAADAYVPAFLRRYPFVLAEANPGNEDFTVCLDSAYAGLVDGGQDGEPLFTADGKNSALLDNAVAFLKDYQQHTLRTRQLTMALIKHELLIPRQISVQTAEGTSQALDGFFVVDENRLTALKGKALQELASSGDLGWIYAHLLSLGNIERLALANQRLDAASAH